MHLIFVEHIKTEHNILQTELTEISLNSNN